jgi:hypothetical protein
VVDDNKGVVLHGRSDVVAAESGALEPILRS